MAIIDDVVDTAKTAAGVVSKKAVEIYDISKLKIKVASLKSEINKAYLAYGKAIYKEKPEAEIAVLKMNIDDLLEEFECLKKLILESRNQCVCPTCGKIVSKDDFFCSACGTSLLHKKEATDEKTETTDEEKEDVPVDAESIVIASSDEEPKEESEE
ncbi:MAG: hypothetical protein ACI4Q8_03635 [Ruminococcus sp.]